MSCSLYNPWRSVSHMLDVSVMFYYGPTQANIQKKKKKEVILKGYHEVHRICGQLGKRQEPRAFWKTKGQKSAIRNPTTGANEPQAFLLCIISCHRFKFGRVKTSNWLSLELIPALCTPPCTSLQESLSRGQGRKGLLALPPHILGQTQGILPTTQ